MSDEDLAVIMRCVIILHDMIVEDNRNTGYTDTYNELERGADPAGEGIPDIPRAGGIFQNATIPHLNASIATLPDTGI